MKITSPAFGENDIIPTRYGFDGERISPPLQIAGVPPGTRSLALIMEDIDSPVGRFTHWVVWNLPPETAEISENALPSEAQVGLNGYGEIGYGPPYPPSGRHRYVFRLYALDTTLQAAPGDRRDQIQSEMNGSVIAEATLTVYCDAER